MASNVLTQQLQPGDMMVAGQALGEPTALLDELFAQRTAIPDLRLFVGMSLTNAWTRVPAHVGMWTSVGMPPNSELITSGRMQLVPCHMSHLPRLLSEGPLATDVALVLVGPPDQNGYCSLGVTSDYVWPAVQAARVVLAEINDNVPTVAGDTKVHLSQITASIRTNRCLPGYSTLAPSALEMTIANHVAQFVRNGTCLQVGIGKVGEAVLRSVVDRKNLGIHAGMIGDTILELMRDGIVSNAVKELDTGLTVAGSFLGSAAGLKLLANETRVRLRSIVYTHAPAHIEALSDFLCVNSALEVDLLGRVNAETAGGRYVGAIGGSVDFLRAATRAPGGRSIVALPATTAGGRSRIVPCVDRVTALGSDVDMIVTEYGVAELRGASHGDRVARLIAVAAPEHREHLRTAAKQAGL